MKTSLTTAVLIASLTAFAANAEIDEELSPNEIAAVLGPGISAPAGPRLGAGRFLVGAARASLEPAPALFGGATWQKEGCTVYGVDAPGFSPNATHLLPPVDPANPLAFRGWPAASPDCIYLGGFGFGPVRPAQARDDGGVWVRAIAVSNGERTFVYAIADAVGWFARYETSICSDCGIRDVRETLASGVGITAGDVVVASTHSHATADTYGGWGGIPSWYRRQLRDATVAAGRQAVANLRPAAIEVGEVSLRNRNNERRDTYHSTADTGATWLQARACADAACGTSGEVIATWATYAGHPTIVGAPVLHADWPGAAARRFEAKYGGVGLLFEGGLGNVSVSGAGGATEDAEAENTGVAIANDVAADIDKGTNGARLASNEMQTAVRDLVHPAMTNPGLVTLATAGLFDREFTPGTPGAGGPGAYYGSKAGAFSTAGENTLPQPVPEHPPVPGALFRGCASAGPTVITAAGAHRIGEFAVAFAPGEIFSNIAEVVKEKADRSAVTMVLGQANDALGYIIQSFEYDAQANVVTTYGPESAEYEEVFSIDRCFGDHVLEVLLESTATLGFGG